MLVTAMVFDYWAKTINKEYDQSGLKAAKNRRIQKQQGFMHNEQLPTKSYINSAAFVFNASQPRINDCNQNHPPGIIQLQNV